MRNMPELYKFLKLLGAFVAIFVDIFIALSVASFIKTTYNLPENLIMWVYFPLFYFLLPVVFLIMNIIYFLIPPVRKYLNNIHKINGLPNFLKSMRELLMAIVYFIPFLLLTAVLALFSFFGYPEKLIASFSIIGTIILPIVSFFFIIKNLSKNKGSCHEK